MKTQLILACICLMFLDGCQPPPVGFFTTDGYILPYEQEFQDTITFVLGEGIEDAFQVEGSLLKKMDVSHFRKSLRLSLYYTFESSFQEIRFADEIAKQGISVVLHRVRPAWKIKSSHTSGVVVDGTGGTSTVYDVGVEILYDGGMYKDGVKHLVLDDAVISETSAYTMSQWPEVFRNAVQVMCANLYKEISQTAPYGWQNKP